MSTQTGGAGETIQSQPEIQVLPEEFSKDVSAPVVQDEAITPTDVKPIAGPQEAPSVIEPVATAVDSDELGDEQPSEIITLPEQQEAVIGDSGTPVWPPKTAEDLTVDQISNQEQASMSLQLKNSIDPMSIVDNDGGEENVLNSSAETTLGTLTTPDFDFNGPEIIIPVAKEDDQEPIWFSGQEKEAYELEKEMSNYSPDVVSYTGQTKARSIKEKQRSTEREYSCSNYIR